MHWQVKKINHTRTRTHTHARTRTHTHTHTHTHTQTELNCILSEKGRSAAPSDAHIHPNTSVLHQHVFAVTQHAHITR